MSKPLIITKEIIDRIPQLVDKHLNHFKPNAFRLERPQQHPHHMFHLGETRDGSARQEPLVCMQTSFRFFNGDRYIFEIGKQPSDIEYKKRNLR